MAHLWLLAYRTCAICDEKQSAIRQAIGEFDSANRDTRNHQLIRWRATSTLATLPLVTMGLALPVKDIAVSCYMEVLTQCTESVEACWELYERGGAGESFLDFYCASRYLAALQGIGQVSTRHPQEALCLATLYVLLKTIFGWHCTGVTTTVQYALGAVALSSEEQSLDVCVLREIRTTHLWQ